MYSSADFRTKQPGKLVLIHKEDVSVEDREHAQRRAETANDCVCMCVDACVCAYVCMCVCLCVMNNTQRCTAYVWVLEVRSDA